ncbi:acyl carrier protein [Sphingomonas panacis]|uniref:acyl carrier protein n=1 Tax=Sphingomonas panacis TaxID=1560345 RepID=UPI0009F4AA4B|nr:acyl carrier protein [Sphingomonas panacis]
MTSLNHISDILYEMLKIDKDSVTPESNIRTDLNIDSLEMVEIVVELEDILEIKLPEDNFNSIINIGDLVNLVDVASKNKGG